MANQDHDRIPPQGLEDCGHAGSAGPALTYPRYPIEEGFREPHMRAEARRALRHVQGYVLEALQSDP
jgi:hypothetical protein